MLGAVKDHPATVRPVPDQHHFAAAQQEDLLDRIACMEQGFAGAEGPPPRVEKEMVNGIAHDRNHMCRETFRASP